MSWPGEKQRHSMSARGINSSLPKKAGLAKTQLAMFGGMYTFPVRAKTMREIVYRWFRSEIKTEDDLNYYIGFLKAIKYIIPWTKKANWWVIDSSQGIGDLYHIRRNKERALQRIRNRMGEENYIYYEPIIMKFVEETK